VGSLICLPVVGVVRYFSWMSRWVGKDRPGYAWICLDDNR
jgi:hypothetical protein